MRLIETVETQAGLYTIQEAAKYARIPLGTLRYWLYGDKFHPPLRDPLIDKQDGRFLTFLEFQEAIAIRSFRVNYGAPLHKIREAIDVAKRRYGVDYPFADRTHRTYLVGKDFQILLKDDTDPIELTGKHEGQISIRRCIEVFMRDFQFDEKNMISVYTAYRHISDDQDHRLIQITMNPSICFGEPIVEKTGYRAQTLWRAALSEGSPERAAQYYEVDVESVIAAYRYCQEIELAA